MKILLYYLEIGVCLVCLFCIAVADTGKVLHAGVRIATCFCLGLCIAYLAREIRKEP